VHGLSKSNFKDHYGDAATEQCLGMIAEINEFSVSDEMWRVMEQTGRRQVDCSRDAEVLIVFDHRISCPSMVVNL